VVLILSFCASDDIRVFNRTFQNFFLLIKSQLISQDYFLREVSSLIHVGANDGSERFKYARFGLFVVWVEPIDEVFNQLEANLAEFKLQNARKSLLLDTPGVAVDLHIASNNGASSSIFKFDKHEEIFPSVSMVHTQTCTSETVDDLFDGLNLSSPVAIVIDTQGSELKVLIGARRTLQKIAFVKVEGADFSSYEGGCTNDQIHQYLTGLDFILLRKKRIAHKKGVGSYYDSVYLNRNIKLS